jgi:hypothetical protein
MLIATTAFNPIFVENILEIDNAISAATYWKIRRKE